MILYGKAFQDKVGQNYTGESLSFLHPSVHVRIESHVGTCATPETNVRLDVMSKSDTGRSTNDLVFN